ncbi:MAG: hypothetical protein NTU54_08220 [Candidatus Omnitrophica bacterium]|nr:hypothetical protein [Candidatus Omnitrophota bacterium]
MLPKLNKRAQTTAEYAILIAIVVGAVVAMQVYIRRGMQERIKNVVDHVGIKADANEQPIGESNFGFTGRQYEPYYTSSSSLSGRQSSEQEVLGGKGEVGRGSGEQTKQARQQVTGWTGDDLAAVPTDDVTPTTVPDKPAAPAVSTPLPQTD